MTPPTAEPELVMSILEAASALHGDEREALLAARCAGLPAIRAAVDDLLRLAAAPPDFLATPVSPGRADVLQCLDRLTAEAHQETIASSGHPHIPGIEIVAEIGRGGMGVVYEGVQSRLKRRVAVKLMNRAVVTERERWRFECEMETLARMEDPGIARVFDAAVTVIDGAARPFFVMEFVDGVRLDTHLASRPGGPTGIARNFASIACAVAHAHGRGIVHRDLKPANVLVTAAGQIKVVDFGVALRLNDPRAPQSAETTTADDVAAPVTRTVAFTGTRRYMAPEQIAGRVDDVDPATDVYALGVMLYEATCGRPPLDVDDLTWPDAAHAVASRPPAPPRTVNPSIPRDLERIILKALAKRKVDRYPNAAALEDDLRRFCEHRPVAARRGGATYRALCFARRHRASLAVAAVLFCTAAVSLWNYVTPRDIELRVEAVGTTTVALSWARSGPAPKRYEIQCLKAGRWSRLVDAPAEADATKVVGLQPASINHFRVRAVGPLGSLGQSNVVTVTTATGEKFPPVDVHVSELQPTSVTLEWERHPAAASYRISFTQPESRVWVPLLEVVADAPIVRARIDRLTPGQRYLYRVGAVNGEGSVSWAAPLKVTAPTADTPPTTPP